MVAFLLIVYFCYLAHIFYRRAFQSGFEIDPVMCQTVNTVFDKNYCPWVSCGEWCLTKTSGFCPQMYATTRRNGTDIQLEGCTLYSSVSCPEVSSFKLNDYKRFSSTNGIDF